MSDEIDRLRAGGCARDQRTTQFCAEAVAAQAEIARYRAGLQRIVDGDGFWDAPALARDLLDGKPVT
jgi:hypothetical protein